MVTPKFEINECAKGKWKTSFLTLADAVKSTGNDFELDNKVI
jgi:hypothetical protein